MIPWHLPPLIMYEVTRKSWQYKVPKVEVAGDSRYRMQSGKLKCGNAPSIQVNWTIPPHWKELGEEFSHWAFHWWKEFMQADYVQEHWLAHNHPHKLPSSSWKLQLQTSQHRARIQSLNLQLCLHNTWCCRSLTAKQTAQGKQIAILLKDYYS